jgi:tetratricopeptide (TPR) repeat protein
MNHGIRPHGGDRPLRAWTAKELGHACGVSDRQVRNWLNGTNLPPDLRTLEGVLFGDDPDHKDIRRAFFNAWATAHRKSTAVPDGSSPRDDASSTTPLLPPTRCLGRDPEAAALVAALTTPDPAALLVLGPAGIGKTTLTRRVATDPAVGARFGPRRYFIPLETTTDPATLPSAIILALGLNPAGTILAAALAQIAQQPALLLLDNLETPWEADQRATQDILHTLATTPNVSLLASLRGAAAPQSPRWTARPTRLHPLDEAAARALFLDLAPEAAAEPAALARFLAALGGVPLALELVAYRAADTPLAELWAEWQRRGVALAEHPDQAPGRLTSLGRSLDLSWESRRLRAPGRRLFRLLGALPAGLADADRRVLLGDDAAEAARQLRAIGLAFGRDGRLDLLPPVRDWARTAHPPQDDEPAQWCGYYLALARDTGGQIFEAEGAAALARLAPEVANIDAALLAAPAASLRLEAVAALDGVQRLLSATGAGSLAPLQALAESCHAAVAPDGEAACHFWYGMVVLNRSEHAAARAAFQQALPLFRQVGDVQGEANCIQSLGDITLRRSEHAAARAAYEQALPLYRQVGDVLGEANCALGLGGVARALSDPATAQERYHAALALYEGIHATHHIALAHEDLARVTAGAERAGHIQAARAAWTAIDLPDQVARLDRAFG